MKQIFFGIACSLILTLTLLSSRYPASSESSAEQVSKQLDQIFTSIWKREKLVPSQPTNDAEFLRRIWIDLAGGDSLGRRGPEIFEGRFPK